MRLKRTELNALTREGRAELKRRQHVSADVAKVAAPYGAIVLFGLGLGLMIYTVPNLRRQEQAEEARSSAELDKLRKEITPQDEQDRRTSLAAEVASEISVREERPVDAAVDPDHEQARIAQHAEVERRVLDRLATIAGRLYELKPHVKLGATGTLLDGVLVSTIDQLADVVVEIKLSRADSVRGIARSAIDHLLGSVTRYRAVASPAALGWLILVVEGELDSSAADGLAAVAAEVADEIVVTVVQATDVEALELPRGRFL